MKARSKEKINGIVVAIMALTGASEIRVNSREVFMMNAVYLFHNTKKTSLSTGLIHLLNQLPISDANT